MRAVCRPFVRLSEFLTELSQQAKQLVKVLEGYDAPKSGTDGGVWSYNVAIALNVLRVLVIEWRESATELHPPLWLLKGVPGLVLKIVSDRATEDRVVMCALELGVAILHGGNDFIQDSFLSLLKSLGGAPSFFSQLKSRLERGAHEARECKLRFEDALANGRCEYGEEEWKEMGMDVRALHSVVREDVREGGAHQAASHAGLILRFLQLLCEGHNLALQNYLRFQPSSVHSVDMISATAAYIDALTPYINPLNVRLASIAMNAIAEFVQNPCRENQRVLADTKLCTCANEILLLKAEMSLQEGVATGVAGGNVRRHFGALLSDYGRKVNKLKASTVTALLSMLEVCYSRSLCLCPSMYMCMRACMPL